jgi:hypothetical protein
MILRQWKEGAAFTQQGEREKYIDYETQGLTRVLFFFFFRLCPRGNLASPEKIWRQGCEHSRCIIVLRPKFPTFQYKFASLPEGLKFFSSLRGCRDARHTGTIQVRCRVIQLFLFLE